MGWGWGGGHPEPVQKAEDVVWTPAPLSSLPLTSRARTLTFLVGSEAYGDGLADSAVGAACAS